MNSEHQIINLWQQSGQLGGTARQKIVLTQAPLITIVASRCLPCGKQRMRTHTWPTLIH